MYKLIRLVPALFVLLLARAGGTEAGVSLDREIETGIPDICGLAWGDDLLWALDAGGTVHGIEPEGGAVVTHFDTRASSPRGLAFSAGYLWIGDARTGEVLHYSADGSFVGSDALVC